MSKSGTILYLDGVSVAFDGFRAINNLSLVLDKGEMRAIIGPNGAGKTTMMDIVTGKTRPDEGEVFFDGLVDLTKHDEAEIAMMGIGRKFQKPTVFESHTVEDNLVLSLNGSRSIFPALFHRRSTDEARRIDDILGVTRLGDKRDTLAANLSHGQKQWLEIGMLLAQDPKLLLVDEPVAGMTDAETVETARLLEGHQPDAFGHRGRARHAFRARARRQGDLPARGLGALGRHARFRFRRRPRRRSLSGALKMWRVCLERFRKASSTQHPHP